MASSNSGWGNGDQWDDGYGQYNKRNKNSSRGRNNNRRYNQWKPKPPVSGEGDAGRNDPSVQPGKSPQDSFSPNSTSTSSSSSGSSPSTVVSPRSDNSLYEPDHPESGVISAPAPVQDDKNFDLQGNASTESLNDTNGNSFSHETGAHGNETNTSLLAPEVDHDNAPSPAFESASENEASDLDIGLAKYSGSANGHPVRNTSSKPSPNSFIEIVDSEGEDDVGQNDGDASVTHASLIVNLSDSTGLNFSSFKTPSPVKNAGGSFGITPLELENLDTSVVEPDISILDESTPPLPPTPLVVRDKFRLLVDDEDDDSNSATKTFDGPSSSGTDQPYIPRKKNSVSFAPNTIDIDEVILSRPTTSGSGNIRPAGSPSILVNGASGGGNVAIPVIDLSGDSEEEEDEDDDSAGTITSNDFVQANVLNGQPGAQTEATAISAEAQDDLADEAADEEVQEINAANELPVTATELTGPNGVKVYVVGTAHFSEKSQQDVIETIRKVRPRVVVLELCQSRRNILTLDEETILREASDLNLEKIRLAIRQSGAVQGMLHILLLSMSAQITKKLGMAPGGEFRTGLQEASRIPNCMIYLGDRSFGITLSRALAALTFKQKFKLCWQFLTTNEDITKEEIERCKEKDLLEKMLFEMMGEYPSISQVFVHERDIYLAHSLWGAALSAHASVCHSRDHDCSLGIGGQNGAVVGVVGMGHVAGIIKHWGQTTEEQISEITTIPKQSLQSKIMYKTIKISFYALVGYGMYKFSRKVFNFPSDSLISGTVKRVPELINMPLSVFKK